MVFWRCEVSDGEVGLQILCGVGSSEEWCFTCVCIRVRVESDVPDAVLCVLW